MKILFYSPVSLLQGGGCERWHCDITNSLKSQFNYEVEIITGNLGKAEWSKEYLEEQLKGVPYIQLKFFIILGSLIPTPSAIFHLWRKIKDADCIHFIHGFAGQDLMFALFKLLLKRKVIVGHHPPIFHSSRVHNFYTRYISRYLLNFFDYHMTLNDSDKVFFEKKWGIKNVFFIPSGVRVEKFLEVKRKPRNGLVFVSVGRYALQKGYDLALQAMERFNQNFPNNKASFLFVGGGLMKPLIQKYAAKHKNIHDLGYVAYENMPQVYAKSDLFFLPSREEPFGLVLIEAWSAGLPVLATKVEGPLDMLKPGINGWFVDEISVDSLYNGLSKIYKQYQLNPGFLKKYGPDCRSTGKLYSIDVTAKRMRNNFL